MSDKVLPFDLQELNPILNTVPTPFYLYIENIILDSISKLIDPFKWLNGNFKNFFALKACPNPHILKILHQSGMGSDCSSIAELIMSSKVGLNGENIMFTSNNTSIEDFKLANQLGAIVNLDDITHISKLEKVGFGSIICCRYNPGELKEGNNIIGNPTEAKYGMTKTQIIESYKILKEKGVKRFGLHTMIVSNMRDEFYIIDTAKILFELALEIYKEIGIKFEFINLGGGIGIPYKLEDKIVDVYKISDGIKNLYDQILIGNGLNNIKIFMENGRFVTGPSGFLITKVINVSEKYRNYIGVDASMSNLMRPGMYGAYHHISVLGKQDIKKDQIYDVTGSLCENNDKFAIQRLLPRVDEGDYIVIHDTGAHGYAMGFQYNGKLRCSEYLLKTDGTFKKIRRAETIDDYFSTLDFNLV